MNKGEFFAELQFVLGKEVDEFKLYSQEWDRAMEDAELEYSIDNRFIIYHHDRMMKHLESIQTLLEMFMTSLPEVHDEQLG